MRDRTPTKRICPNLNILNCTFILSINTETEIFLNDASMKSLPPNHLSRCRPFSNPFTRNYRLCKYELHARVLPINIDDDKDGIRTHACRAHWMSF